MSKEWLKEQTRSLVKPLIGGLSVCLILMIIMSVLMKFTPISERWVQYYSLAVMIFSCICSGMVAGYYQKKQGILNGFMNALILLIVLFLIYFFAVDRIVLWEMFRLKHILCLIGGAVGGMIGVNSNS